MAWHDDVRKQNQDSQQKELSKAQERNIARREAVDRLTAFWNRLILANQQLPIDLQLRIGSEVARDNPYKTATPFIVGRKTTLYLYVMDDDIERASHVDCITSSLNGGSENLFIRYNRELGKFDISLNYRGATFTVGSSTIDESSIQTLLKYLCLEQPDYSDMFREFNKKGCFIATAVYGSSTAPEVLVLRQFRDQVLLKTAVGTLFVTLYYSISPGIARFVAEHNRIRRAVRRYFLDRFVKHIQATCTLNPAPEGRWVRMIESHFKNVL